MDFELLKYILIPIAVAITGHQYKKLADIDREILNKIDEDRVRSIINDKSEALHLADKNSQERLDRVEDKMVKIDEKLDKIMGILLNINKSSP